MLTRALPSAWWAPLQHAGLKVVAHHDPDRAPERVDLLRQVAGAAALWVQLSDRVDAELLDAAGPSLQVVATYSVGTDHIDVAACKERGVLVLHTPDVLTDATADLAMALMLAAARRLPEGRALIDTGWPGWAATQLLGLGLTGRTLALIGFGRIGQAVARRALPFGLNIAYHQRRELGSETLAAAGLANASYVADLDELLRRSDIVSLHAPATPETHHLLDARRLALLPPHAIVVNTARGNLIDEAALAAALRAGRLGGAGLDVFEFEPRIHPELLTLPNVVMAPHLGSATVDTRAAMALLCSQGIASALAGEVPANTLASSLA